MSSDELSTPPWRSLERSQFSSSSRYAYQYIDQERMPLNASELYWQRQQFDIDEQVRRRLHVSPAFIDRLEQETLLIGHDGCVNCLEWTSDGRLLASGSDDYKVMIWDPFRKKRVHVINTQHLGNMFSVKFLPRQNDRIVATCAADKFIYVYDINHNSNETLFSCHCHSMRIKRLATAPDSPHIFWSAGEDGNILQLDMREQHNCRTEGSNVRLINLCKLVESTSEAKCVAINPRRTEYIAVGTNDPYARIYDRRMIKTTPVITTATDLYASLPVNCVSYYAPGQIVRNISRNITHESRAITYLCFNANGTELLVNMGCEHIYRYDLHNAAPPVFFELPAYVTPSATMPTSDDSITTQVPTHKSHSLPSSIERHKKLGNEHLENGKLVAAIDEYSAALVKCPQGEVLYLNRATALMRRGWFGDIYAALRDCHEALRLDPTYVKAHFRLARALLQLQRPQEADKCLQELIERFPSFANNHGVLMLNKDIRDNQVNSQQRYMPEPDPTSLDDSLRLNLSEAEYTLRSASKDYLQRYVGHCNITTDIKEASYLGANGDFIAAGSDDGNFYIWERDTAKIRAIYRADSAIVNCVQPHPNICMLATSGIDHDIKIWSPCLTNSSERSNVIADVARYVEENQKKMRTDPFELNTGNAYCFNN